MPQNSIAINGAAVRAKREALFLNQGELAAELDLHPNTISQIEGQPEYRTSFRTVRNLAKRLGCEPGDLLPQAQEEVTS